jgi:signal transduction histidine kinase
MCVFEVEDNAGGIASENLEKVFDKGFTTKENNDGTGIGLDMSRAITQNHLKGNLEVRNSNDGAIFSLKILINQY